MGGTTQPSGGGVSGGTISPSIPHAPTSPYSWGGASFSDTADPKSIGTLLLNNIGAEIKQGPQAPIASYNPFTPQTRGLIDSGLGQVGTNNAALTPWANGSMIGQGNPYLNDYIKQTNNDVGTAANAAFNSSGLYGSDAHARGLAEGIGNADNTARFGQYNTDVNQMLQAQGQQGNNTAQGLGYSGLLDSKNAEQIASNREQQAAMDPYNFLAKNWGLLTGSTGSAASSSNVNQPTSIWDILGGVGSFLGSVL